MRQRILCFDIAKSGLMIWIIGIWHLSNYTVYIPGFLEGNVSYLVTIGVLATFTFISGYLAAMSNNKNRLDLKDLLFYYKKRFIRLYPLYLVAVILFWMFGMLEKSKLLSTIFIYFPFINEAPVTIWYIGIIFLFYLMAPFINAIKGIFLKILICSILNFLGGGMELLSSDGMRDLHSIFYFSGLGCVYFQLRGKRGV